MTFCRISSLQEQKNRLTINNQHCICIFFYWKTRIFTYEYRTYFLGILTIIVKSEKTYDYKTPGWISIGWFFHPGKFPSRLNNECEGNLKQGLRAMPPTGIEIFSWLRSRQTSISSEFLTRTKLIFQFVSMFPGIIFQSNMFVCIGTSANRAFRSTWKEGRSFTRFFRPESYVAPKDVASIGGIGFVFGFQS